MLFYSMCYNYMLFYSMCQFQQIQITQINNIYKTKLRTWFLHGHEVAHVRAYPFSYAGFRPFLNRTHNFYRCVLDASSFLYWTWTQNLKKTLDSNPFSTCTLDSLSFLKRTLDSLGRVLYPHTLSAYIHVTHSYLMSKSR
jgi:hypothetical protein